MRKVKTTIRNTQVKRFIQYVRLLNQYRKMKVNEKIIVQMQEQVCGSMRVGQNKCDTCNGQRAGLCLSPSLREIKVALIQKHVIPQKRRHLLVKLIFRQLKYTYDRLKKGE